MHPYTYVHNNPVNWTDPTGRCILWLDPSCRPFWEAGFGWEDFQQYSAGVVEGLGGIGGAIASLFKEETWDAAGRGLDNLFDDPRGSLAYLYEQRIVPIGRGAELLFTDPGEALRILNENPRAVGQLLGTTTMAAYGARAFLKSRLGSTRPSIAKNPRLAYLEYKALRLQGIAPEEAVRLLQQFRMGINPGRLFGFHFTTEASAAKIIESCMLKVGPRGMRGPGIYGGMTPTPSWLLKHTPAPGWGLMPFTDAYPFSARVPILLRPDMNVQYLWNPFTGPIKAFRIPLEPGETLPLVPPGE